LLAKKGLLYHIGDATLKVPIVQEKGLLCPRVHWMPDVLIPVNHGGPLKVVGQEDGV
jgi:hypothetical protein